MHDSSDTNRQDRDEVRSFLRDNFTDGMRTRILAGEERVDPDYHRALMATGWFSAWFQNAGDDAPGRAEELLRLQALWDESTAVGAPVDYLAPTLLVGSALSRLADDDLVEEIVDGILAGHVQIALGLSEPDTGSDLAAVRTRATKEADGWIVSGEKTWTTNATIASHLFLLARTDPSKSKHDGLTVFLVPMGSPGISTTPIETLADHPVHRTLLDGVRLPDRYRIGAVDGGWSVMRTTLAFEHGVPRQEFLRPMLDVAVPWATTRSTSGQRPLDDPEVRAALVDMSIDCEVAALMRERQFATILSGDVPGPEANIYKLFHAEAYTRAARRLVRVGGLEAILEYDDDECVMQGVPARSVRTAQMMTIVGGTSEIHRDVIAQRLLGLPRKR